MYVIYDSRVIYALNWLIFLYSDDKVLFPQPNGRNSKIEKFDQKTIFNLSGTKYSYHDTKIAYIKYCELLQNISNIIDPKKTIYELEMLLFLIAVEEIIEDIKKNVKITVLPV